MNQTLYKRCARCGETFPATLEYFTPNKGGKYGLRPDCKKCHSAQSRNQEQHRRQRRISALPALITSGPCVYVVHFKEFPSLYKIGSALNVTKRLQELEDGIPFYLVLDHVIHCSTHSTAKLMERVVHSRLRKVRYAKREWFELSDDMVFRLKTISIVTVSTDEEDCSNKMRVIADKALGTSGEPFNVIFHGTPMRIASQPGVGGGGEPDDAGTTESGKRQATKPDYGPVTKAIYHLEDELKALYRRGWITLGQFENADSAIDDFCEAINDKKAVQS